MNRRDDDDPGRSGITWGDFFLLLIALAVVIALAGRGA